MKKNKEQTYLFRDGFIGKRHKVKLCSKPIIHISYTKDFARMIQLFRNITDNLNFTKPFRVVIEYNPEQLRVRTKIYEPTEVLEQYTRRVKGKVKD